MKQFGGTAKYARDSAEITRIHDMTALAGGQKLRAANAFV